MARACRLLDAGAQSLAQQLGYEDSYYFSRVFRRVIGMLPSHYRALHHG
jgi:AraC-like DNA-binding protein